MTLEKFISLAEPEHLLIQVSESEVVVYEGKYYMYPKVWGKRKIHRWHIENGKLVIAL